MGLQEMSSKELRALAAEQGIDISAAKKKADIILALEPNFNETEKENNMNENEVVAGTEEEVVIGGESEQEINEEMGTDVPTDETAAKKVFTDAAGNELSMSAFVRMQFNDNNLSRKEISEKFDINYRTVYGATINMENDSEKSTRGRGLVNPIIKVTAEGDVYTTEVSGEGEEAITIHMLNGVAVASSEDVSEVIEMDRNAYIKEQVEAGAKRGDIAKNLGISYGVVYGITKESDGARVKHEVEVTAEDGTVTMIPRSEYIRTRVAEGVSKADVAKELGVEYSVVWQATKKEKADQEKFDEAIETLRKFADKVVDGEAYLVAVEALAVTELKVEEEEIVTPEAATEEEAVVEA